MSYGQNVPFYPDSVDVVDAVDPADVGWRLAAHRIATSPVPILRSGLRLFHRSLLPLPQLCGQLIVVTVTRRFWALPGAVALVANGWLEPAPSVTMATVGPSVVRSARATASARAAESAMSYCAPPLASV